MDLLGAGAQDRRLDRLPTGSRMTIWLKTGTSSAKRTSTSCPASCRTVARGEARLGGGRSVDRPADERTARRLADVRSGWI
jgi:hypothetical protein